MKLTRTKKITGGAVAALGAGSLALALTFGSAAAQTAPNSAPNAPVQGQNAPNATRQQAAQQNVQDFINRLAGKLGMQPANLSAAIKDTERDMINARLAAGQITQQQATTLLDRLNNSALPVLGLGGFEGHPGKGGPGARAGAGQVRAAVATALGLTPQQLQQQLTAGQSLAQLGAAKGLNLQQLHNAVMNQVRQQAAQAISNGRITQQQADQMLQQLDSRLDQLLTDTRPADAERPDGQNGQNGNGARPSGRRARASAFGQTQA